MGEPYNEQQGIEFQQDVQATYQEAEQALDLSNVVWSNRMTYDAATTMTYATSRAKHLRELRVALGLPVPDPPPVLLPRLVVNGKFFTLEDGTPWTMIEASDFNLLGRFMAGEDIQPVLAQRRDTGFNTLRVFTAYDVGGIGRLIPSDALYEAIPSFLNLCAAYQQYVELVAFTGPYTGLFANERAMLNHWGKLVWACGGMNNVFLEAINEADNPPNQGVPLDKLFRPAFILSSHGSNCADQAPVEPVWDYGSYHSNDLSEWQRKTGHNTMEMADLYEVPCTGNENTRFPDNDSSEIHAYDAAKAAALLCAGSCYHSIHGKSSELWDSQELVCAANWARGAREVPLEFQVGQYHHLTSMEGPGIIRVYDRTLPDGRQFIVTIRA